MALNEKQKQFCKEYVIDFNGAQAAKRAGYSEKTARTIANTLLTNIDIQATVRKLIEKRSERTQLTADDVVRDIIKVKNRCMQGEPVLDREGNETGVWKFDSNGANKALDMLMKHTGGYELDNKQQTSVQRVYVTREDEEKVNNHIDGVING